MQHFQRRLRARPAACGFGYAGHALHSLPAAVGLVTAYDYDGVCGTAGPLQYALFSLSWLKSRFRPCPLLAIQAS